MGVPLQGDKERSKEHEYNGVLNALLNIPQTLGFLGLIVTKIYSIIKRFDQYPLRACFYVGLTNYLTNLFMAIPEFFITEYDVIVFKRVTFLTKHKQFYLFLFLGSMALFSTLNTAILLKHIECEDN